MTSQYSTLKLELITIGETGSAGNWGTTTNNNLGDTGSTLRGIEQAIGGYSAVTLTTTSTTLSYTDSTANQNFRSLFLNVIGSPGAASTLIIPSTLVQKTYIIKNGISGGYSLTVKYAASTGTVIPNGSTAILYANGTDVVPAQDYIPALTLGSALPVSSGGTGITALGTGVATWLGTPSSANLAAAVTDETGTGSLVFATAPVLISPSLSAETFSTAASITAGTNVQGQGALTSDYSVITTASANPSGVTLPAATTGRRIVIVNKGINPVNIYPATGGYIDALTINSFIQLAANGVMEFNASSATQWYSSYNLYTSATAAAGVTSFSAGSTGLSPSAATSGAITLAGTLAITNGGTGASSQSGAINALVPSQAGQSGKYLTTDGSNVSWGVSGGTVTSVGFSTGSTGLTVSGSPITSSGTFTLAGTLAVANGGTGATSQASAINNLIPSQAGQSGKYLTTDGSNVSWATVSAGGGTVTSVGMTVPAFLSVTGSPVTSSGTLAVSLSGTALPVANGGTGATSSSGARSNIGAYGSGDSPSFNTITATGDITAYFSDERLKTKLGNIENALDKVCSLNGFYYEPNDAAQSLGYKKKKEVGLSAQEVEKVLPEIIAPAPIDNQYMTIHYEKVVPLLVEAIKELRQEIAKLKEEK